MQALRMAVFLLRQTQKEAAMLRPALRVRAVALFPLQLIGKLRAQPLAKVPGAACGRIRREALPGMQKIQRRKRLRVPPLLRRKRAQRTGI